MLCWGVFGLCCSPACLTANDVIDGWLNPGTVDDKERWYASLVATLHSHHGQLPTLEILQLAQKATAVADEKLLVVSVLTLLPWNDRLLTWFRDNLQPPVTTMRFQIFLNALQHLLTQQQNRRTSLSSTLTIIKQDWTSACRRTSQ